MNGLFLYLLLYILQLLLQFLDIGTRGGVSGPIVHQRPGKSIVHVIDVVIDVAIAVADAGNSVVDRGNFASS